MTCRPLVPAVALLLGGAPAAALTTVTFTGQVTHVLTFSAYYGSIAVGGPIQVTFTFDASVADGVPLASFGSYASSGPGIGFAATLDGVAVASAAALGVGVGVTDASPDQFSLSSGALDPPTPVPHAEPSDASAGSYYNQWTVAAMAPASSFARDSLVAALPVLPLLPSFSFEYQAADGEFCDKLGCMPEIHTTIRGDLTLAAPEPARGLLTAVGVALLAVLRRRRPRAQPC
jgi:hypothetical protein